MVISLYLVFRTACGVLRSLISVNAPFDCLMTKELKESFLHTFLKHAEIQMNTSNTLK